MGLATPSDIKQLGTILSVWAHPDDESFMAAGIMAAAVANGQRVVCVTATKGEAGLNRDDQNRTPEALGTEREAELRRALKILGVSEHHWLGYADGACAAASPNEALRKLKELIKACRPDTILTFGPEGLTGHPDHQTVSAWVNTAVATSELRPAVYHVVHSPAQYEHLKPLDKKMNIFFMIDKPPLEAEGNCAIAFHLPEAMLHKKRQALLAMVSQTTGMLNGLGDHGFAGAFGDEYFIKAEIV